MDYNYATPDDFCPYHKGMGRLFRRCAHKGQRFVVQVQGYYRDEEGCIDYVDHLARDGLRCQTAGYFKAAEEAEALWQEALGWLMADKPVESG